MAPTILAVPAGLAPFKRAFNPEVGPDHNAHRQDMAQDVRPSDSPIPTKYLTPRFNNLSPWPYIAVVVISVILACVLVYGIVNCYRKAAARKAARRIAGLHRISLVERRTVREKNTSASLFHRSNSIRRPNFSSLRSAWMGREIDSRSRP